MSLWRKVSLGLAIVCVIQTLWLLNSNRSRHLPTTNEYTSPPSNDITSTANNDSSLWLYYKQLFVPRGHSLERERLTLVMLTYKREDLIPRVTRHYCSMTESIESIIVIWNDIGTSIPPSLLQLECEVKLKFIISKENKLTNRFLPREEITTEGGLCVCACMHVSSEYLDLPLPYYQ